MTRTIDFSRTHEFQNTILGPNGTIDSRDMDHNYDRPLSKAGQDTFIVKTDEESLEYS